MRLYLPDELGPDGYPPEWHATIKHEVRLQADHRCVRCLHPYPQGEVGRGEWTACDERCAHGGPVRATDGLDHCAPIEGADALPIARAYLVGNGSDVAPRWVEAHWRVLTVHHLDVNKANCRWWNLAALCQRCHLQIQGKVLMARVWPWEHSEWFRPYVAGYYAWVYLREEVTREEAEGRLDELLALERQGSLT